MNAGPAIDWSQVEGRLRPYIAARVGQPADVDDILQTVLLKAYERGGMVRDPQRLTGWLFAVTRNAITDHFRRRNPVPDPPAPPDDDQLSQLVAQSLAGFVELLPPIYRDAVRWVELEGLTQKAAAARAGISLSGMKSRVQRGRAQLVALFHECCALELDRRGGVIACIPRDEACDC